MRTLGHYVNCDDAVCLDCWNPDQECESCGLLQSVSRLQVRVMGAECQTLNAHWSGFETWEEPAAILSDYESDTPTHCCECHVLLPHQLTRDGYAYVAEKLAEFLRDRTYGNPEVMRAWWKHYGPYLESPDLRGVITDALED